VDTGTVLQTGSTYPITASWATTSSYSLGIPTIKAGVVSGSFFAGNPKIHTIVFTGSYPTNLYSVVVSGETNRVYTIQSKSGSGFTINTNNNTLPGGMVFWQTITQGEFYN
jgi:hypothetical protein